MAQYTPMMEQYLAIKAQYKDAFLFFRLGDFYELFFDDAVLAARELEITLTGRDAGGPERIPMCGVPYHSVDNYLQILLRKGYKIAVCEQVEDPKTAKGVVRREVVRVLTPGTVMEGTILAERENNYLVAAVATVGECALAACDISTGQIHAACFNTIERLAAEVLSYHPGEVIIQQGDFTDQLKSKCIELGASNIQIYDVAGESKPEWESKLKRVEHPLLRQTVSLVLNYISNTQKRTIEHIQEIDLYQAEMFMYLDPFSKRNLELLETVMEKKRTGSLLWYLDHTVTAMGARMIRNWVEKPLIHQAEIEQRLDAVEFFKENMFAREQIRDDLKEVYDLERLAARVSYGNANAKDLVNLKRSLEKIPTIKAQLSLGDNSPVPPLMQGFLQELDDCQDIVDLIERAIEEEPAVSLKEGGIIKEGFDPYLDKLKTVSREGKNWIAALEQKEREATGIKSLKIGFNKVFGYYIEVTRSNLSMVPLERFERKQTLANAERYVTPELKEKEALILDAEEQLTELEYQVFTDIRKQIADQVTRLQRLAKITASFDVLSTLAHVAHDNRLVRPIISNDADLVIREGRHPVVEKVLKEERFIANDTLMDTVENRILLITGPNMAGKSTYMRQLAIMVIMAQMGSFVSAEHAEVGIVDRIFTRIGAADDLVGGQSTFMVEMKDIQMMTTGATPKSLVIIDEIGRGTSTHDGLSIAQAVIEYLQQRVGCKAIISTHFHELAVLEETLPALKNYHMAVEERDNNVIFLRKLKRGATSESYGIYCAKVAGLPDEVISRAEELLRSYREGDCTSGSIEPGETAVSQGSHQLDLFAAQPVESQQLPAEKGDKRSARIIKDLREIDLINMTPLQALNYLFDLKQKLKV